MKQNKIRNLYKRIIPVFLTLLIYGCQKDDATIQAENQQESKIKRISLNDFSSKINNLEQYNKLEQYFDFNIISQSNLYNRLDAESNVIILTDEIIYIQEGDIAFYTFKVLTDLQGNEFYNLVVQVNQQQEIIKSEFFKYTPSEDCFLDTNQPFFGYVEIISNDFLTLNNSSFSRLEETCVIDTSFEWLCNYGNNHAPGEGQSCTSWEYIITFTFGPCPAVIDAGDSTAGGFNVDYGTPNDNINNPLGGGSGDGGTSTVPTKTCDSQVIGISGNNGCISENDCNTLKQDLLTLINNPTINSHINGLKDGIFSDIANNYKEDGVRFAKTGNNQYTPRYPNDRLNNGLDYQPDYQDNETVSIHIHQQKFWDITISPNPFFNAPVPSDEDIIELLKNVAHINTTNPNLASEVTQIVMTEAGVFAMIIDTQSALNALTALEDEKTLNKFKERFDRNVLKKWNKINQNAGEVCDADCLQDTANKFKKFVENNKVAGSKLKAKVLQAIIDENNQITDWICN
jgi:hypothetical protein